MSVNQVSVFQVLKLRSKGKKRDAFDVQSYETLLKTQLSRNEMLFDFQEEAVKANQEAISFYNARKEKLNRTLKQFEEEESKAKQTAANERFLLGIKGTSASMSSSAYKSIIENAIRGVDAAKFTRNSYQQLIANIWKCSEVYLEDLQQIIPICLLFDSSSVKDLQSLQSEANGLIESLKPLLGKFDDASAELHALGSTLSGLLNCEIASRLVHPTLQRAKSLVNTIGIKLGEFQLQQQQLLNLKSEVRREKSKVLLSEEKSHLFYVEEARTGATWVQKLERSSENFNLPSDVSVEVDRLVSLLRFGSRITTVSASIDDFDDGSMEATTTTTEGGSEAASDVVNILMALQKCLPSVIALGSGPYIKVFLSLMQVILSEVQLATSETVILLYAALLTGAFEAIPSSMVKESAKIVRNLVVVSRVCVPDFLPSSGSSVKPCDEKSIRILTLKSALIGRSCYIASPLTAEDGWTWLVRASNQLSFVLTNTSGVTAAIRSIVINSICRSVRVMLKFSGFALFLRFQDRFSSLLSTFSSAISKRTEEEAVKLAAFMVKHKANIPPLFHDQQTPHALKSQELTSQLTITKNEVALIDQDKTSQIFETIRQHQIDRLRVIFNKLSATVESQNVAVSSLLEKLLIASKVSPDLLRYTLYKISNNIISDSQEEVFNETDEGHPTKLARVSCGLCREIQDLSSVIQSQFYDQCPLAIPRNAKEGLVGEDFLLDLRFRKKKSGVWEDKQQWLTRMTKMLSTFAVIVVQPEQIPFSMLDGWKWLASLVNAACVAPTPAFYVAAALEVFLRIVSPKLLTVFGEAFMQLLRVIRSTLLPKLNEDTPRRQCLQEFLQRFIDSKGQDFMTLFQR